MYVICDNQNIVRNYAEIARYVKAQSNGVTVLADSYRNSTAIYCEDDNTYWATKESIAGQKTYTMYQVAEVPEGAEVNITRYNTGSLEIDPELKAQQDTINKAQQDAVSRNAQMLLAARVIAEQQTDEATILSMADLYEEWAPNHKYKVGKILKYGTNAEGKTQLYKVAQEHTSAAEWLPDQSASLYTKIGFDESGVEIWHQPSGAHDAYAKGDVVSHNGELWESTVDGNVWEPGVVADVWTKKEE